MKKRGKMRWKILTLLLFLATAAFLAGTVTAVPGTDGVTRYAPADPVPGAEFDVKLTISGERPLVVGIVETIPEGFDFVSTSHPPDQYDVSGQKIVFAVINETEILYRVNASSSGVGTFTGTWIDMLSQKEGSIAGTGGIEESSTPTPTPATTPTPEVPGFETFFTALTLVIAGLFVVLLRNKEGGRSCRMRNVLSYILVMVLIGSTVLLTVMPAIATGIPGDNDGNDNLTEKELAGNILNYMLGEGDLSLDELRDAAHVYAYWNGVSRTIVDTAERTVTIYKPVKKIVVLSSDGARALRILGDEDKVVGISETIQRHPYYFPEMSQRKSVGTWKEVDWEEIVALGPDLVITYATGSINADLAAEKLDPFGITVVGLYLYVTDEYEQIFDELEKLAILLEKEEAAEKYLKWHDEYEARVHDFIAGKEKPNVFMTYTGGSIGKIMEIASYGPGAIDYTLCEKAGGRPITEDFSIKYPKVSAEWVLTENPDIIILKSGNVFGGWDNEAEPADLIAQMMVGKNWDDINATENNKIYAVPWSITNGLEHIYGEVLLAKICQPELDIDPTEVYTEFLEDFLRVEYPEGKVLVYPPLAT